MDSRQESFRKLRGPCVELSSVSLRFRGRQAVANDVLLALEPVYAVLNELGSQDALDEKLAEYSFFPLSHIFNETQRVSARCLELAVNCLQILVTKGWRQRLSPQMGKQLIILLTLIVGGTPNQSQGPSFKSQPEELAIAGFNCLSSIFSVLQGQEAERTIFNEIGTATVVDQTVYILLEGVIDDRSDGLCLAAAGALQTLYLRIVDRVVLASMMPRTVSTLTKVLKPTTQIRHSYRVLVVCLQILTQLLKNVLSDHAASVPEKAQEANARLALDDSWLKASATQTKLALANVILLRRHERPEVQDALLGLCLVVIEDCPTTLRESLPMMVETIVVLSGIDEQHMPNSAYSTLKHLAITYPAVLDSLKDSLYNWITSFPRVMKSNDETIKQWGIRQISTTFQILSEVQSTSDILTTSLATGLCDSVTAAIGHSTSLQPLDLPTPNTGLEVIDVPSKSLSFPPVLLEHRSQQQTLQDLQSMIVRLNGSDCGSEITRSIITQMHNASRSSIISPFWLALNFLKQGSLTSVDDFISFDHESSLSSKATMIEELYCVSLPLLNEPDTLDWRVSALALEAIALQAQQLGEFFRPELMDALYPTLQFLASGNPGLQRHAMTCLNILAESCNYPDVSAMIIDNVDYLVNSVSLKLNTFDVSPYPPQVLLMMVKLCGARLIPYLDDLIDAVFGILNMYHGYPKLVELMFRTLAVIVEEGTKEPAVLAITDGDLIIDHRKKQYQRLQMSTLTEDIAARAQRVKDEDLERIPHPKEPWGKSKAEPEPEIESLSELLEKEDETEDPLPPPKEPEDSEKPLSRPHTLLLHIVKSIPSHLSSPSPYLRRSLLSILNQVLPTLAHHENSFLPLINDLWPSVASKITFPAAFTESSSTSLTKTDIPRRADDFSFQEEIYVITTACQAIETMCKSAGDFMASRVEAEYPRWERLYRRAWERVGQDADKAIERRQQQSSGALVHHSNSMSPLLSLTLSSGPGTRTFTPQHTLWRALTSLFITLLSHVRLPLATGDQICEFLAAWVTRYAGPGHYFGIHLQAAREAEQPGNEEIESALHAMDVWNADLTWFIFQQERAAVSNTPPRSRLGRTEVEVAALGGRLRFAEVVF